MGTVATALSSLWNLIPEFLRRFIGYGLAAGIALVMVVLAFLSFPLLRDYIKEQLGIRQDVQAVSDNLQERTDEQLNAAIVFTSRTVVNAAMDSLAHANDSLFARVSTDLIEPGIVKLNTLEAQVQRLNVMLGVNNDLAREQAQAQRQTLDQIGTLQQRLNTPDNAATLEAILTELRNVREEQEAMRDRLNKTTKQKF